MKRLTRLFNTLPKRLAAVAAVAFAAIALPVASIAATDVKLEGSLGVANVTAGDTKYSQSVNATYDQVVKLQVYYHNTELPDSGKVADNVRVKINIPSAAGQTQNVSATIKGDNTNTINSAVTVNLDRSDAYLQYIPGSAVWKYNSGSRENPTYTEKSVSDEIVYGGSGLVLEDEKPCYEYASTVTVLARVMVPGVTIDKTVRVLDSGAKFGVSNTANPGDTLEYRIAYQNTGNTVQNKVVIRDSLPTGLTLVPGTTQLANAANGGQYVTYNSDNITNGGIVIGNYGAGANAYIKFQVKIPSANALSCGVTEYRNVGVVHPEGMNEYFNTALTTVNKECAETPAYTCDAFTLTKGDNRTVKAKVDQYTATNGASLKTITYNFGDGSEPFTTNDFNRTVDHSYAKDGTYSVTTKLLFSVDGQDKVVESGNCADTVNFTSTPPELPKTGPGAVIGLFAGVTILGALAHRLFLSRRFARS